MHKQQGFLHSFLHSFCFFSGVNYKKYAFLYGIRLGCVSTEECKTVNGSQHLTQSQARVTTRVAQFTCALKLSQHARRSLCVRALFMPIRAVRYM